ncbi:DUF1838 domain-containing protein (plasmid) [Novosphingobium sp. P6W]|nr:DUF1838 domain-containing protein [Novosphingobium sp. P6W]
MVGMKLGRRDAVKLVSAGLALGATSTATLARTRVAAPVAGTPEGRFRSYMMMRAALDERLVIGYVSGSYFGVVGAEVTPLWDVVGATFARYRKRPNGGYDGVTGEIAHFLDPGTGEAAGRFLNPYTGKWMTDPRNNLPPSRLTLLPTLELEVPKLLPGTRFDHVIKVPEVRGDDTWITEVTRVGMPAPPGTPGFNYSEMVTLHARTADLQRTDVARVPCLTSFTNVVDWRPWMDMAGHPGHLTAIGSGRYGVTLKDLPDRWTVATRKQFPAFLDDPGALLDPLWNG